MSQIEERSDNLRNGGADCSGSGSSSSSSVGGHRDHKVSPAFPIPSAVALTVGDVESMLRAVIGPIRGSCTDGDEYDSLEPLWGTQLRADPTQRIAVGGVENDTLWYTQAFRYWEDEANCPVSDGTLLHPPSSACLIC